jgi:hypothetical protein
VPYIVKEQRERFQYALDKLFGVRIHTAGELNYLFTMISNVYIKCVGESYQVYNDIIGALEGAKLELYRRKVAAYEDSKIASNGDV